MKVVKLKPEWKPVEYPGIEVGDAVDITNPQTLIDQGMVEEFKVVEKKKEEPKEVKKVEEVKEIKKEVKKSAKDISPKSVK